MHVTANESWHVNTANGYNKHFVKIDLQGKCFN